MDGDDPPVVSASPAVAGSTGMPCVYEVSEVPRTRFPSALLLRGSMPETDDVSQSGGCAAHALTAATAAVVAVAHAAPRPTVGHSNGKDSVALSRQDDDRSKVDMAFVNASLQPLTRSESGAARHLSYNGGNNSTGGGLKSRGSNAAAVAVPFCGRVAWTRQTTPEPFQRDGDVLCAAEALHSSTTAGADDKDAPQSAMASVSSQRVHFVPDNSPTATATDVFELPATPPLSPEGAYNPCDDMDNLLHSRRHRHCYTNTDSPGLGGSDRVQTWSAASSASSAPHSTAETQWCNTSEASEPDLHEITLPIMDTSTGRLTAVSSVCGGEASLVTTNAQTADTGANGCSPISVSAVMSPNRQSIAGLQQSSKGSGRRRKRLCDTSAVQSERHSCCCCCSGQGDTSPVSLEKFVTRSAGKPMDDAPSSLVASLSQKQIESLDGNTHTPTSTEATTATTLTTMESGSAPNPSSSHCSLQSVDSHHALQRSASLSRMCVPRQEMAPSLHPPMPIRPGGAVVASTILGVSVRSPVETATSLMLPMLMVGSTASLIAFPRSDTAFPLRTTLNTLTKSVGDESQQPLSQLHDQGDEGNADQPPLTPTAPVVTPAAQHLSNSIAAARRKNLDDSSVTSSRQQEQQAPSRQSKREEANVTENGSSNSLSALPQQSLRNFTVTSATSFCVDNAATAFDPRSKTAEHSSLHTSAISMRQSSAMSEDQILQTLAHGMALGGVLTGPWKAAQDNSTPTPLKPCASDPGNWHLTGRSFASQQPPPPPSRSVVSGAMSADCGTQPSPTNCTTSPCGSSLMVPHMHREEMSLYLGSGTQTLRSRDQSPAAGLAAPPTHFSELQMQRGRRSRMSSTKPAGARVARGARPAQMRFPVSVSAASGADEAAETGSHLLTHGSFAAVLSSPTKRRRGLPSPGYLWATAEDSLRDAGGSSATTLPALLCSALHTERSLATPMRGYSLTQRSSGPSVEGVIFSAGSTPNLLGCVEAGVTAWLPAVSSDNAARQLSGDRTVMLRHNDSSTAHYHVLGSGVFSIADSGVAVGAPMEALRAERFTFLQSVQDVGGLAAQAETGALLGGADAVPSLLGEEIAEPAAMVTPTVSPPTPMPSSVPAPHPTVGFVSGWMRRIPAGRVSTTFPFNTAGTAASSLAKKAAVLSGNSSESPDGARERISALRMAAEPMRVANDGVATASITPMAETSSVRRSPPPAPAMLSRLSLTRNHSYQIPGSEISAAAELRRTSSSPCATPPWAIGGANDLVAAVATPPLPRMVSLKDNVSARPREGTRNVFQPVLPLAQEENAATSLSYELGTPKAMSRMPASRVTDESMAGTDLQQLWWTPAVARAAAPFRATGTDTHPTPVHPDSGESGMHSAAQSLSSSSPRGLLPQQQQTPRQLQTCASAPMQPSLYSVHNNDDKGTHQTADCKVNARAGPIRGSLSRLVERAAGMGAGGGEGYGQSCRANGGMLFHKRGTLTGGSGRCHKNGGKGGGGTGSPLRISIPRYQRYRDVETLLDDAERAMSKAAVPIISLLGCDGPSLNEDEYSFELLGNGLASSVMSLATPVPTSSNAGMDMGLVSPLTLAVASNKPAASPTGTKSSFSLSEPSEQ
ncbi:hypothetical protein, unknown function [Leishmania mexicana MHOM/GT/2001/U1103]|uniref:Uncharacterized protein n=1 Tax=Leishmania mexicana (strain MHOM/GT/2001/U1103) TaxID=929439 RepID=E9AYD0_LEIMU|nr:hypothetical protein, unknown function [Leishmania mexicana MHOM/GT/2001/U1103]CBZ27971.1 hypothetical protein, unknown function [Leishmania mexicana MHOM/GT/2001/U1103]